MSKYHHLMIANFLTIIDKYVLSEKGQRIRRMSATCSYNQHNSKETSCYLVRLVLYTEVIGTSKNE